MIPFIVFGAILILHTRILTVIARDVKRLLPEDDNPPYTLENYTLEYEDIGKKVKGGSSAKNNK